MTVVGKVAKPHGKHGVVKIVPLPGMYDTLLKLMHATALSIAGERCELEDIREYTRGRCIGRLSGVATLEQAQKFRGGAVVLENA